MLLRNTCFKIYNLLNNNNNDDDDDNCLRNMGTHLKLL